MSDDTAVVPASADPATTPPAEEANAKKWLSRINAARKHDEEFRKRMAKDRAQARGDSEEEVAGNPLGINIEIVSAFLYARNPGVDVLPSESTKPPTIEQMMDAAEHMVQAEVQSMVQVAQQVAMTTGLPFGPNEQAMVQQAALQDAQAKVATQFEEMKRRFRKRQRENRAFADTLEIVITYLWKKAKLKKRAKKMVRSTQTVGAGWLWASWQQRTARSPETTTKINDAQSKLKQAEALRRKLRDEGQPTDTTDADVVELRNLLASLQKQPEPVVHRGFVIDFDRAERIQVALGVELDEYLDAAWIARQVPKPRDLAISEWGLSVEEAKSATKYHPRKPTMGEDCSPTTHGYDSKDAEFFLQGDAPERDADGVKSDMDWLMGWEVWNREAGTVGTLVDGVARWVKVPEAPECRTTRFYPCFLFADSMVDGARHPQSRVTRASKLADDYNRRKSAEAEHRRRILPKTLFDRGNITADDAKAIVAAQTGELVGIKPQNPAVPLAQSVVPLQYPPMDPMLYETQSVKDEIGEVFGTQDALRGNITQPKTATEAEIEDKGFNARSSGTRDELEDVLSELAEYTAEVAWCYMDEADVVEVAGPDAFWPEYGGPQALNQMVNVEIRAGSSGKPNSRAEREAWAALLPLFQQFILTIGQMRGSPPSEIADCLERLANLTAERSGDRIEVESLIPQSGPMAMAGAPAVPGAPGQPGAPAVGPGGAPVPAGPEEIAPAPPPPPMPA